MYRLNFVKQDSRKNLRKDKSKDKTFFTIRKAFMCISF